MKALVCCLFVIANISFHGKASLDSISLTSANVVLEDLTKFSDKSCYRPCKFNVKPKRCHYTFRIEPSILDDGKPGLTINENRIPDQDLAMHWHGVDQKGSPYMDGVPMVTQCPIVSHQNDGVYGSLVVNQPQPLEPHSSLYDYDRSKEHSLLIGVKFPVLMTGNLEDMSHVAPESLLINGDKENTKLFVMQGYSYRLRLINAIAIECPVAVSIDQHEMIAIATDGRPVKPVTARSVQLYPGERMDVVVRASQESGGYWVRVQGTGAGACATVSANAMLLYSGFNYTSMLQENKHETHGDTSLSSVTLNGQMMESLQDVTYTSEPKSVYLGIDRNLVNYKDDDIDFRYGIVQINSKSFLYPNAPILLKPEEVVADKVCNVGFGSNDSYTFHMHGLGMQIIATGQRHDGLPLSKNQFLRLDQEIKIARNTLNPPTKDTVTVPNKGYTIVRLRPERGSWLFECRSCGLSSLPAAIIIQVQQTLPKAVVEALPKCGNYRPPDVLLN
ncbi:Laccase-25 [Operophtera brumata]|uniref:Laccase-25 n=1 Tax=Operophtera brumata TaxID=104452 RepID=A0A0L7LUQ7_OPEBR|nr:Laccase-25 [Operophtera brumata]